jgi:hypothetical protein
VEIVDDASSMSSNDAPMEELLGILVARVDNEVASDLPDSIVSLMGFPTSSSLVVVVESLMEVLMRWFSRR